ncbi:glycosyltransferase [Variovorax sp. J31P207]|uniref:glycosyltransferase n=1 Tax=Variovorax sp. J31P207 TaxID=3053510 RepID=UPI00257631B9|nr:glycosyltransferase [Variovorax sp. J31P207]MDM0067674.1 glycosyltransferase [Variovorax sp. J31P207]
MNDKSKGDELGTDQEQSSDNNLARKGRILAQVGRSCDVPGLPLQEALAVAQESLVKVREALRVEEGRWVAAPRRTEPGREDELEQRLAGLMVTYEALLVQQGDVDRLRADLRDLRQQLHATLSSHSWRLTAPLRLFVARHPQVTARLRDFVSRHPRLRAGAARVARVGWRLLTQRRLRAGPPPGGAGPAAPALQSLPVLTTSKIVLIGEEGRRGVTSLPRGSGTRVLCVGHVLPYPPRAGNEYRIHRMLSWLAHRGHDVLLVVCPLPNEMPTDSQIAEAAAVYPGLIVCGRDGAIRHNLSEASEMVRSIDGFRTRDLTSLLKEDGRITRRDSDLLGIMRTFCPDVLVELLRKLDAAYRPDVLLAEYVFMTRSFAVLNPELPKIVDTHDVLSTKASKVGQFGISDGLSLSQEEEAKLLNRANIVIGIQPQETLDLARMTSHPKVINAGVDFPVDRAFRAPSAPSVVLLVASNNAMNAKGLRDFLRFSWPLIRRRVPEAEFRVVGDVGRSVGIVPDGVHILGRLDDLEAAYTEAGVVINPMVAGTGLKIKTVEALSFLRPLVTFPAGVDGVDEAAAPFCNVATDWYGFAQHVARLLASPPSASTLTEHGVALAKALSPGVVYSQLADVLDEIK